MLVAHKQHLVDQFRDAPLIYPTLLKSFALTILPTCFKIAEEAAMSILHGKSFHESTALVAGIAGASWKEDLNIMLLLFVMLIPFLALPSYGEFSGKTGWSGLFTVRGIC